MGYKDLEVWKAAMQMVEDIYALTSTFPASEQFGLTAQLRRAAISIPANIAEGYGRRSEDSFVNLLRIAKGSVNEVETLLLVSERLSICSEIQGRVAKIGSMLTNLISKVRSDHVSEAIADYFPGRELVGLPSEA